MQAVNQHLSSTSLDFPSASHFSLQKRSKIPDFLLLHLWLESSSNSTNLNHLLLSQKKKKKKNRSASVAGRGFSLSAFIPQPSVLSQTLLWLVIWISKLDVCRRWMSKQSQTKQYTRLLTLAQPEGKKKKRKTCFGWKYPDHLQRKPSATQWSQKTKGQKKLVKYDNGSGMCATSKLCSARAELGPPTCFTCSWHNKLNES